MLQSERFQAGHCKVVLSTNIAEFCAEMYPFAYSRLLHAQVEGSVQKHLRSSITIPDVDPSEICAHDAS